MLFRSRLSGQPGKIVNRTPVDGDHKKCRVGICVTTLHMRHYVVHASFTCFDDHDRFAIALTFAFPAIDARHCRDNVNAGGKAQINQLPTGFLSGIS